MTRSWIIVAVFALILGSSVAEADPAPSFEKGATLTVKANSIWFQDADRLAKWQRLKRASSVEDLADYEHDVLSHRDAWQFINPLTVKVLGYDAERGQATVEMETPGRMQGTTWFLDAGAIER